MSRAHPRDRTVSVRWVDLELRSGHVGERSVLFVTGDLDLSGVPRFTSALARLVSENPGRLSCVDFDGAGLVDDTALGLVLGAAGRARAAGGDVAVVCTNDRLRARLTDTGFDRAVRVGASVSGL